MTADWPIEFMKSFCLPFFLNFCWDSSSHLSLGLHCLEKIISLSFSWKQLWRWIKKILAIRQKKWNRSLIILVDLMNWIVSDKLFLDFQLIHSFMPNSHKNSWMVSILQVPKKRKDVTTFYTTLLISMYALSAFVRVDLNYSKMDLIFATAIFGVIVATFDVYWMLRLLLCGLLSLFRTKTKSVFDVSCHEVISISNHLSLIIRIETL